jgi:error-prone DNA polymerase
VRGKIQREGAVVHLVAHQSQDLARDGEFPLSHVRGDENRVGGSLSPNRRNLPPPGVRTRDIYISDLHIDTIRVKTRDFR